MLAGTVSPEGGGSHQVLLVRKPGGAFVETAPVPVEGETLPAGEEPLLLEGEALFGAARAPLIAPLEEAGGEAGALRRAGQRKARVWRIRCCTGTVTVDVASRSRSRQASHEDFRVLAIGASSPANAWLLAQLSSKRPTRRARWRSSGACRREGAGASGAGSRSRLRAARGEKRTR